MKPTVYTVPEIQMRNLRRGLWRRLRYLPLCFLLAVPAIAADYATPERQLAQKISAVTGPAAVTLEWTNRSGLTAKDVEQIRRDVLSQLGSLGVRLVDSGNSATLRVTLSESAQAYVWVAEIRQGSDNPRVVIVSSPRSELATAGSSSVVSIRKTWLWSQPEPVLDAAVIEDNGNPSYLIVLDNERISLYHMQNNNWQQEQSLVIPHSRPWPRDIRGRVLLRKDHLFDLYLPGVFCASSAKAPLTINCREGDEPWPVASDESGPLAFHSASRNFFTGAFKPSLPGPQAPRFYSAVALPRDKYTLWAVTGVDGQLHLLDGMRDQVMPGTGWGSQIASAQSACGGSHVLASRDGDGSNGDSIRAYAIPDREPVALSAPVDFNGPVTAMWTAADGRDVTTISHNTQTGNYDVFRLAIVCSQ
jgi:hypothetical protein